MIGLFARKGKTMNIINGFLLLTAAVGIALHYRPVKLYSWVALFICVFSAVVAFLSAPPASLAVGAFLGVFEIALVLFSFLEVRAEYRERKRRTNKSNVSHHTAKKEDKPLAG